MQARLLLIVATLGLLVSLISAKWVWIEQDTTVLSAEQDAKIQLNSLVKNLIQQVVDDSSSPALKNYDGSVAAAKTLVAERKEAIEKQSALINEILETISKIPADNIPDSKILSPEQAKLIPTLFTNTAWKGKQFVKCFQASRDGYHSHDYHKACDNKGALLTIVQTTTGNIFGGFSSVNLDGVDGPKQDINSFLFSMVRAQKTDLVKLPLITGTDPRDGPFYRDGFGPVFGRGFDLKVSSQCNENANSYSDLGHSYSSAGYTAGTDAAKNYLAGEMTFACADYEVFQLV